MVKSIDWRERAQNAKLGTKNCCGHFRGQKLDPTEFYKAKSSKDGVQTQCRACHNFASLEYQQKTGCNKIRREKKHLNLDRN